MSCSMRQPWIALSVCEVEKYWFDGVRLVALPRRMKADEIGSLSKSNLESLRL